MMSSMSNGQLPVLRLGQPISNVWLLPSTPAGPVLVDCGHALLWPTIHLGLRRAGLRPRDLAAVLLTHRHSDHAGNAARLAWRHGVPIHAHQRDARVLTGQMRRPSMPDAPGVSGFMCWVENSFPSRRLQPRPLEQGDEVAGLTVHWAPGHTAGSVFLHHPGSGTVFTGDTLLSAQPPLIFPRGLALAYPPFCEDRARALRRLAAFVDEHEVRRLCPGHGRMLEGDLSPAIRELVREDREPRIW